jgi:hypothetical protein
VVGRGLRPFTYPQGSRLPEHRDGGDVAAAMIHYCHDAWEPGWGGQLVVAGTALEPVPNRLILVKGGTPHAVALVNERAGDHVRESVIALFKEFRLGA